MSADPSATQLACTELMAASYRIVDDGQAAAVTELFTEDGRFTVEGNIDVQGQASLSEMFAARQADTERRTLHCLSNLTVAQLTDDEAQLRATLTLYHLNGANPTIPSILANVEDVHRLIDGQWRIASRTTRVLASSG